MEAMKPLRYDYTGSLLPEHGISAEDLERLAPRLEEARREVLDDVALWRSGETPPVEKQPLDAGFFELPERLLEQHAQSPESSELGRILQTAERLREQVDRVVVLGIGGSYMGARALFEALCHPYHNEQTRQQRQGRPRLYFEGNNVDNDFAQALLDLLHTPGDTEAENKTGTPRPDVERSWGIIVISKSGGTLETATALRIFLRALEHSGRSEDVSRLVVPVTGETGRLRQLANALGCQDVFDIPDGVGGRFSIFTAVGLLPAAVLGIDIVRLLEGAAAMNRRFRQSAFADNPVLQYVGVGHLMEQLRGATIRVLSVWSKGLEAAGLWYDQLLAESLGKQEQGATPLTVVNTRDLHSRGQQHQQGRRDKLITNLIVDTWRRDPLAIGTRPTDEDQLNALAEVTLPEIMAAAVAGTNQAYLEDQRPTTDLHLPALDEPSLGQWFQMMMLATVVEGRLIGINPYGQPGVEAYKRHMNEFLKRR